MPAPIEDGAFGVRDRTNRLVALVLYYPSTTETNPPLPSGWGVFEITCAKYVWIGYDKPATLARR